LASPSSGTTSGISARWGPGQVLSVSADQVLVAGLLLIRSPGGWDAFSLPPLVSRIGPVQSICGDRPADWTPDKWHNSATLGLPGFLLVGSPIDHWGDLAAPASSAERSRVMRGSMNSRPGPSGWKQFFLLLFPDWAQEAHWLFSNARRACAVIAVALKIADQVFAPKPKGGHRPLAMIEESFKNC